MRKNVEYPTGRVIEARPASEMDMLCDMMDRLPLVPDDLDQVMGGTTTRLYPTLAM